MFSEIRFIAFLSASAFLEVMSFLSPLNTLVMMGDATPDSLARQRHETSFA